MIHTIDLQFQGIPESIAAFLVTTSDGPVLVECGPYSTLPHLREAIAALGYQAEDIRHVFLTHIHFDHAGAAWWFAQRGATIYLHPAGVQHLSAPQKLWESARRIYGEAMELLWGSIQPIELAHLRAVEDRETISVGDRQWIAHHTPGHAVHHIAWQLDEYVFTGDVAGVKIGSGPVVPPCPPPDIMVSDWLASIARLRELGSRRFYLTHYGPEENTGPLLEQLANRLNKYAEWMRPYAERGAAVEAVLPEFEQFVQQDLYAAGVVQKELLQKYEAANPGWMSVSGLLRYWRKYGLV